jgi:hypothetical protein
MCSSLKGFGSVYSTIRRSPERDVLQPHESPLLRASAILSLKKVVER